MELALLERVIIASRALTDLERELADASAPSPDADRAVPSSGGHT
ncbi:hypothetical protein [Streptomyces sp. MBT84]|nr:hypothetical protein [Streptomyces sp. MBT84]